MDKRVTSRILDVQISWGKGLIIYETFYGISYAVI